MSGTRWKQCFLQALLADDGLSLPKKISNGLEPSRRARCSAIRRGFAGPIFQKLFHSAKGAAVSAIPAHAMKLCYEAHSEKPFSRVKKRQNSCPIHAFESLLCWRYVWPRGEVVFQVGDMIIDIRLKESRGSSQSGCICRLFCRPLV